jgi:hypothetical protein
MRGITVELQELVRRLTEVAWTAEQQTHHPVDGIVLGYVRDAVTAEIEYRRRRSGLEARLAEFEVLRGRTVSSGWSDEASRVFAPGAVDEALRLQLAEIDRRLGALEQGMARIADHLPKAVQGVGVVRYNAFPGMGGNMSFSLALLDGRANGVVVSVLNGRESARVYGKLIEGGQSSHALSAEERQALAMARGEAQ